MEVVMLQADTMETAVPNRPISRREAQQPQPAPRPVTPEPRSRSGTPENQKEDRPLDARPQPPRRSRRLLQASLGALLLLGVAGGGYLYWDDAAHFETTDDAFIAARQFAVAPKVAGYLGAVPVTDNQHVVTGQVIARIDDRDYRTALAQAEGQVASAQATIDNFDAQLAVQETQVATAQAQLQQQQANLSYADQQASRYGTLAKEGWGTVQDSQNWSSQQRQAQAQLEAARNALVGATRQLAVLKAQRANAEANLTQADAQRDQARLNLSYTTVTAAQPGRVVQLSGAVGQYVQAGSAVAMFVPDDIWVTANFKETQLEAMRPGDKVSLSIDAYPNHAIQGHVASVQPGSGTAFSLLPAQNATGNYVKIVQRVPVKVVLDDPPADVALGPGMSVVPTVRVDPSPTLIERLERAL
jgi:membrane fusion protein, multidrug efflux system